MRGKRLDLKPGDVFTRLTIIKKSTQNTGTRHVLWVCRCECGNIVRVRGADLTSGNTKSCGCLKRGRMKAVRTKVYMTHDGRTQSMADWAREIGIPYDTLKQRKTRLGWTDKRALTTPLASEGSPRELPAAKAVLDLIREQGPLNTKEVQRRLDCEDPFGRTRVRDCLTHLEKTGQIRKAGATRTVQKAIIWEVVE